MRLEDPSQRAPFDELHRDKQNVRDLADAIHRNDVGMLELGHHPCFALEPLRGARRDAQLGGEHLDGDGPPQLDLAPTEHHTHAAARQLFGDLKIAAQHHADALEETALGRLDDHGSRLGIRDEHAAAAAEPLVLGHRGAALEALHGQRASVDPPSVTRRPIEVSGVAVPTALECSSRINIAAGPARQPIRLSPAELTVTRVESGKMSMRNRCAESGTPWARTVTKTGVVLPTVRTVSPVYVNVAARDPIGPRASRTMQPAGMRAPTKTIPATVTRTD